MVQLLNCLGVPSRQFSNQGGITMREMRRFKQALTPQECAAVLERNTAGVLALTGDGGEP